MEPNLPIIPASFVTARSSCKNACVGCSRNRSPSSDHPHVGDHQHHEHGHSDPRSSILIAEGNVLPTLRSDGSRIWLSPSLSQGFFWHRRRWLAYGLIAFFVTLPHLRISGKPYVLMDIAKREFTFVGHTFYPTDTPLLACLMLMVFFSVMLLTALAGRVWCGWGCPQTVYLEFLFRPIDRFFSNTIGKGGKSRNAASGPWMVAKFAVYLICCAFLAHTFLSYFVGTDRLAVWMRSSPTQHPTAFMVMGGATIGLLFNFLYFREQFCMIACPYGRLQSVMLDRNSFIVAYDSKRGEPRKRGKRIEPNETGISTPYTLEHVSTVARGDCIECGRCTAVCPTGIDIRNGLQLECIHCAQCIDACDDIMRKIDKPTGLIRYTSQDGLVGKPSRLVRARTAIYLVIVAMASVLFSVILSTKFAFDARILRMPGAPFSVGQDQHVQNNFRIRLVNRSQTEQQYTVRSTNTDVVAQWSNPEPIRLSPGGSTLAPIDIRFPIQTTGGDGFNDTDLVISDKSGKTRDIPIRLLGPR